jgi:hypothetical protein
MGRKIGIQGSSGGTLSVTRSLTTNAGDAGHSAEGIGNVGVRFEHQLRVGLRRQPLRHRRLIRRLEHRLIAGVGRLAAAEGL